MTAGSQAVATPEGQFRLRNCPSCSSDLPENAEAGARCPFCGGSLAHNGGSKDALPPLVQMAAPAPRMNPAQDDAVHSDGNLLITACPGSGKTFVLRSRAVRKLKEDPKARGIAVTFTREAANELESRVMLAYPDGAGRLVCGTFHSLCRRQLKNAGITVNLVNEAQGGDLLHRAWREISKTFVAESGPVLAGNATAQEGMEIKYDVARNFVDKMKSKVHPPLNDPTRCPYTQIYLRYQELLRQSSSMDFSDMLVMVTQKMATGEVQPLIGRGGFMLVDEAQDSDSVQLGWVRAHMEQGIEIAVVGDDDQSIYGWRFAEGYLSLTSYLQWSRAKHINLDTTYRCAREVLAPAGRLIKHNKSRIDKDLRTENLNRGEVRVVAAPSLEEQIILMADFIVRHDEPRDWGIIVRTNRIATEVEKHVRGLEEAGFGFPLTRGGGKSFWDLQGPALYLGLCRSLWFDDMVGIDPILQSAGVSERRISQLHHQFPTRKPGSLTAYLLNNDGTVSPAEERFRTLAAQWRALLRAGQVSMATMGMTHFMCKHLNLVPPGTAHGKEMTGAMRTAIGAAGRAIAAIERSKTPIGQRLRNMGQDLGKQEEEEDQTENAARLMTFHSSKGLEFRNVWLLGCDEDVIPSKNSENMDEERRLFYVGMTRAKQRLVISHTVTKRSQFIEEAGL